MDVQNIAEIDVESWVDQGIRLLGEMVNYLGVPVVVGLIVLAILGHYGAFKWGRRKGNGS